MIRNRVREVLEVSRVLARVAKLLGFDLGGCSLSQHELKIRTR